jgi:hypothetical protein
MRRVLDLPEAQYLQAIELLVEERYVKPLRRKTSPAHGFVLGEVLAAVAARRNIRLAFGLALLLALQFLLGHLGVHHPWAGAFHGLTAIAVAAIAGINARRSLA